MKKKYEFDGLYEYCHPNLSGKPASFHDFSNIIRAISNKVAKFNWLPFTIFVQFVVNIIILK